MLWVVTFMQVFGESGYMYAYLCIMQGSASNFADFQFWPYWPSLNCYNFCSSPSLPMKVVSNWALESSLSFNIKSIQKKCPWIISKGQYIKLSLFTFSKILSFSTNSLTLLPWGFEVTKVFKQNRNTSSLISYLNQVTRTQRIYLMLLLWVVTLMQVFAESRNVYLCIMQGSVSNFADFRFWPYCPICKLF